MEERTTFTIVNSKQSLVNIVRITVVVFAATILMDLIHDIKAIEIMPILPFLVMNLILLALLEYDMINLKWCKIIQLALIFGALEMSFIMVPNYYHAIIYWMVYLPTLAIILLGIRYSIYAIGLIILANIVNAIVGINIYDYTYTLELGYISFMLAGTVFAITIYLIMHRFYILLQKAYEDANLKNKEIEMLNAQLNELNAHLKTDLAETTKEATIKSMKLERIAVNNSHVVRAPLANILGAVDLFGSESNNDQELINIIKENARKLDDAVNQIGNLTSED